MKRTVELEFRFDASKFSNFLRAFSLLFIVEYFIINTTFLIGHFIINAVNLKSSLVFGCINYLIMAVGCRPSKIKSQ